MTVTTTAPPALLTPDEHAAVTATVLDNNPHLTADMAARIVDQALAYVATAAANPHTYISPSRTVDEGWHALILHTALYARLCERLGRFVHHYPERPDPDRHDDEIMARTVTLIQQGGHTADMELWRPPGAELVPVAAMCSHTPLPGGCGPIGPEGPRHCGSGGGDE